MKRIESFKSFSALQAQVREEAKNKEISTNRELSVVEFNELLSKYNVSRVTDLNEDQLEEFMTSLMGEGNSFGAARAKAIKDGDDTFEVGGEEFPVEDVDADDKENAEEMDESIVTEASQLLVEGTRGQVGIIDKKGNITSIYTHYDSYPENVLPIIKKHYKDAKAVKDLVSKGNSSGIEAIDNMNFYNDGSPIMKGNAKKIDAYLKDADRDGGAEYVYLYDEATKTWMMADIYNGSGLKQAFESVTMFEAKVEMDAMDPDNKDFLKFLKKNHVKIISKEKGGPGGGAAVITMLGSRKNLEAVLADGEYGWDDADLAEYIEESVTMFEAKVEMDAMDPDNKDFLKFLKKNHVKIISKEKGGPGGGAAVITMLGSRKNLEAVLADGEYGWDDADLAEYIEESVNEALGDKSQKAAVKGLAAINKFMAAHPAFTGGKTVADQTIGWLLKEALKAAMIDANFGQEANQAARAINFANFAAPTIFVKEMGGMPIQISKKLMMEKVYELGTEIVRGVKYDGYAIIEAVALYMESRFKKNSSASALRDVLNKFVGEAVEAGNLEERINEGRAFAAAARNAKDAGEEEFEFNGNKFPVLIKEYTEDTETVELNEATDIGGWNQGGPNVDQNVLITQYVGPKAVEELGMGRKCTQINVGLDYIQLNPADIVELKDVLKKIK